VSCSGTLLSQYWQEVWLRSSWP